MGGRPEIVEFTTRQSDVRHDPARDEPAAPELSAEQTASGPSLVEVLLDRLAGSGPPARQVWLPPLAAAPSMDSLLPSVVPDPVRGMTVDDPALRGRLRVPIGIVDRPQDQIR